MSAGDPKLVGDFRGGALYVDAPSSPRVSYAPDYANSKMGAVYVTARLVRTILCLKKDVLTVVASLTLRDAAISVSAGVDLTGAAQTVDYGTGWQVKNIDTPNTKSTVQEVNIEYEKSILSAFAFDLPANVTVVFTAGKVQFKYKTTVLEEWDSGKGVNTTGITTQIKKIAVVQAERKGVVVNNAVFEGAVEKEE